MFRISQKTNRFGCTVLLSLLSLCAIPAIAQQCNGQVISTPDGMREVQDDALLKTALGEPGKGSLCTAKVFEVQQPVRLFRVYNAAQPASLYGRWWSLQVPVGPDRKSTRLNSSHT